MSMKEVLLILLVISTGAISGEASCGRLIETELYNDKSYTEQEEHPWLGRILYRDVNGSSSYRCTVVLLNSRHVLAPALCVKGKYIREQTPFAVMFGNPVCLSGKTSPRSFEIDEVFVPPEYNQTSYKYDLAVIRLMEHVLFSKHIQPICLPQSEEILSSLAGRYVELIGHETRNYEARSVPLKTYAHLVDHSVCQEQYKQISPNQICGYIHGTSLQPGAFLAGVRVVSMEPTQYYLIGHLLAGFDSVVSGAELFMYIAPYRDWIEAKINMI